MTRRPQLTHVSPAKKFNPRAERALAEAAAREAVQPKPKAKTGSAVKKAKRPVAKKAKGAPK